VHVAGPPVRRISGAQFNVDGKQYRLLANEGTSSIHGGEVSAACLGYIQQARGFASHQSKYKLAPKHCLVREGLLIAQQ
jgi:hypothetical protein